MTATQRKLKALLNEESSVKETLTTLTGKAKLSDEERAQLGESEQRYTAMQVEVRAARTLVEAEGEGETRDAAPGAVRAGTDRASVPVPCGQHPRRYACRTGHERAGVGASKRTGLRKLRYPHRTLAAAGAARRHGNARDLADAFDGRG